MYSKAYALLCISIFFSLSLSAQVASRSKVANVQFSLEDNYPQVHSHWNIGAGFEVAFNEKVVMPGLRLNAQYEFTDWLEINGNAFLGIPIDIGAFDLGDDMQFIKSYRKGFNYESADIKWKLFEWSAIHNTSIVLKERYFPGYSVAYVAYKHLNYLERIQLVTGIGHLSGRVRSNLAPLTPTSEETVNGQDVIYRAANYHTLNLRLGAEFVSRTFAMLHVNGKASPYAQDVHCYALALLPLQQSVDVVRYVPSGDFFNNDPQLDESASSGYQTPDYRKLGFLVGFEGLNVYATPTTRINMRIEGGLEPGIKKTDGSGNLYVSLGFGFAFGSNMLSDLIKSNGSGS